MTTLASLLRCPQCKSADIIKISTNDLVNHQCQNCSATFTEPRVEAGDRALETARKIRQYFLDYYEKPVGDRNFDDGLVVLLDDFVAPIVEEYKSLGFRAGVEAQQSAMNAQEREIVQALQKIADNYGGCRCDHSDEDCCEKSDEFCPHCISEIALARRGGKQ